MNMNLPEWYICFCLDGVRMAKSEYAEMFDLFSVICDVAEYDVLK